MTHKYLYIQESSYILSDESPIYIVMVGATKQCNRDFLFLTSHAVANGHYFELWNKETAIFVHKILKTYPNAQSRIKKLSARQLVKHIKANTACPYSENQLHNTIRMQMVIDTYFRITSNINSKRNGKAQ